MLTILFLSLKGEAHIQVLIDLFSKCKVEEKLLTLGNKPPTLPAGEIIPIDPMPF